MVASTWETDTWFVCSPENTMQNNNKGLLKNHQELYPLFNFS